MSAPRYVSPLRYPGGKAPMAPWLASMFNQQLSVMDIEIWLEPFAGGAGAALTLLDRGAVEEAWLVDANPAIAAFWQTVVEDGGALARRIESTVPTLELFGLARELVSAAAAGERIERAELGYAAFIVNRCSRSGIVAPRAGVMGGKSQAGEWTLASRFNAEALAGRVRRVHALRQRLRIHHGDGIAFIEEADEAGAGDEMVMFVDPPYIREGNRLYANGFDKALHQRLADALNGTGARWMLTYDDEPAVPDELYPERRVLAYDIRNNANRARIAREYAVFSDNLDVRGLDAPIRGRGASWVRQAELVGSV